MELFSKEELKLKSEIYHFFDKKSKELGWEGIGDFVSRHTTETIIGCLTSWAADYTQDKLKNKLK